jgi:hypothetical protein
VRLQQYPETPLHLLVRVSRPFAPAVVNFLTMRFSDQQQYAFQSFSQSSGDPFDREAAFQGIHEIYKVLARMAHF